MLDRIETLARSRGRRGAATLMVGVAREGEWTVAAWGPRGDIPGGDRELLADPPVFEIGSLTKPLTGALLADMCLRGEVRLEDRLRDHLPAASTWPAGDATLEQLATHRSGLPNTPRQILGAELAVAAGFSRRDPWDGIGEREYRRMLARTRPRRPPGRTGIRYSSLAFGLLGDALAARAGRPYGELLRERLLEPLGMESTAAGGVSSLPGRSRFGRPRPQIRDRMPAGGGVRSTVPDLLRWLAACARPAAGAPGPALDFAQRPRAQAGRRLQLGLGWLIQPAPDGAGELAWHNGLTYGFRSFGGVLPGRGIAVAALANGTRSLDRLGFELLSLASET